MGYTIHANRFGVTVIYHDRRVRLTPQDLKNEAARVYESSDGITVQDPRTGERIFIPDRIMPMYNHAIDSVAHKLEELGLEAERDCGADV